MTIAWLSVVLAAAAVRIEPDKLILGKDQASRIEIRVTRADGSPASDASVQLAASVGSCSSPEATGPGQFRATYLPPNERFPQVAIIVAHVEGGGEPTNAWTTVQLLANATLKIKTKPRSVVDVYLGGKSYGPLMADPAGKAQVTATIPPGVTSASVHATDRAGNENVKPLEIVHPPYPRVMVSPFPPPSASWTDPSPLSLEAFAVAPDGSALSGAQLKASVRSGKVLKVEEQGKGIYRIQYLPPDSIGSGYEDLGIEVLGATKATPSQVRVELRPGPAVRIDLALDPPAYLAGSGRPIAVKADAADAKGNRVESPIRISTDLGKVELQGQQRLIEIPDFFEGREQARIDATVESVSASEKVQLKPGPPAAAEVQLPLEKVRAADPVKVPFIVRDRFGNPVPGMVPMVAASRGQVGAVTDVGKGRYEVEYRPPPTPGPPAPWLDIRTAEGSIGRSPPITIYPPLKEGEITVGPLLGRQSSTHANATLARLSGGYRIGKSGWEALVEGEADLYDNFSVPLGNPSSAAAPKVNATKFWAWGASAGIRRRWYVGRSLTLHASALWGIRTTYSTLTISGLPDPISESDPGHRMGYFRIAGGGSYRLGPGDFAVQIELLDAPMHQSAQLQGNTGGLGLSIGYWFSL